MSKFEPKKRIYKKNVFSMLQIFVKRSNIFITPKGGYKDKWKPQFKLEIVE